MGRNGNGCHLAETNRAVNSKEDMDDKKHYGTEVAGKIVLKAAPKNFEPFARILFKVLF